jgi:hypothetical protein
MSLYIELSVLDNLDNRVRQLKSNASSLNLTSYYTCVYEPTEGESVDSVAPPWGGLTCPKTYFNKGAPVVEASQLLSNTYTCC